MKVNSSIFRPADIRGRVREDELNVDSVELVAKAYGTFLRKRGIGKVIVGYDSRPSSKSFNEAVVGGLLSTGCSVIEIGMVLTPIVYWAQYYLQIEGAVMITGSHNPPEWNGFKLARGYSYTIFGEEVQEIRQIIENAAFAEGRGLCREEQVVEAYFQDALSRSEIFKPLKVAVDCGNGTAGAFVPKLLRRAGCDVVELYCNIDPSFPHHFPDPTIVESRRDLTETIRKTKADLGLLFDGDGDRLGVTDEQGNTVWADELLIVWSREILQHQPGANIVFDVKCSQALVEEVERMGGVPVMWRTGNSFIKQKCREVNAPLAGEMSGHLFFADRYYGFDDALYSALRLLETLSRHENALSEIMAGIPRYYATPEIRVDCSDENKFNVVNKLVQEFKSDGYSVFDIDGARVNFHEGWGLVRASSNLPVLTLRFEAKSQTKLNEYMELFRKKLSAFPEVGSRWTNVSPSNVPNEDELK